MLLQRSQKIYMPPPKKNEHMPPPSDTVLQSRSVAMKYAVKYTVLAAAVLLSACALTPEQQAEREAARIRARQNLQVGLAAQCDPETARLMRRQFDGDTGSGEKERQAFRLAYLDRVNDKMFQACYKMAWQSYAAQVELEDMRRYRYYDDWWYGPRPWGPWWW